ncbi:MAG: TIGR02594 family protein [Pseudomonadota bacterium]
MAKSWIRNTDWRWVQTRLKTLGFDPGPIDGEFGPLTQWAVVEFKKSRGLKARPFVGPITIAALRDGITVPPRQIGDVDMPPWLRLAHGYMGLREIPGPQHAKEILNWWQQLGLGFRTDETPWCAGFVNAMILKAGLPITPKYRAAALGWRWTGYGQRLEGPALGAVMSMVRPGRPGSGHMTFVAGIDRQGRIQGVGGNQGNRVRVNSYGVWDRDAQYHWPEGTPMPEKVGVEHLPLFDASGAVLRNEA